EALRPAVPALARAVLGSNTDVRLAAMNALRSFGVDVAWPAVPMLATAVVINVSPDARVRKAAAETLGSFGPGALINPQTKKIDPRIYEAVIPILRRAIGDDDAVRAAASDALLNLLDRSGKSKEDE